MFIIYIEKPTEHFAITADRFKCREHLLEVWFNGFEESCVLEVGDVVKIYYEDGKVILDHIVI